MSMSEGAFQTKVIKYLKNLPNTWYFKVWGGGFQRSGIPDIICCINGHFVALELKTETGRASKLQEYNIRCIKEANGTAILLRPSQFEEFKEFANEVLKHETKKETSINT